MIKVIGGILIVIGCSSFGFKMAADHIRQLRSVKQFISVVELLTCELQYRLSPLPNLCDVAISYCNGSLKSFFIYLKKELEAQVFPDVERCVSAAIYNCKTLPSVTEDLLESMGQSLGRFDLDGQVKELNKTKREAESVFELLSKENTTRTRTYKTLAVCAGLALAILFI